MKFSRILLTAFYVLFALHASTAMAVTKQVRVVAPFFKIKAEANVEVHFTQQETQGILIEAEERFINNVVTKESNGTLIIRNNNKSKVKVYVHAPSLTDITVSGASSFTADSLKCTMPLNVNVSNASACKIMNMQSSGHCSIAVSKSSALEIELESTADTEIKAQDTSLVNFGGECAEITATASSKSSIILAGKCNALTATASNVSFIEIRDLKYDRITQNVTDIYSGIE
jgi:hypothetical protein